MEIGDKIDYLTLEGLERDPSSRHMRGIFRCVCGNTISRFIHDANRNSVNLKHCGCMPRVKKKYKNTVQDGFDQKLAQKFLSMKF